MRTVDTQIIEVYAEVVEVQCDIEDCDNAARPNRSAFPRRAEEPFERAVPALEGWMEVRVSASPGTGETGGDTYLHVCPKHMDGAQETTDLLLDNLTPLLQGYLVRQEAKRSEQSTRE